MKARSWLLPGVVLSLSLSRCGGAPPPPANEPLPELAAAPEAALEAAAGAPGDDASVAEERHPNPDLVKKALERSAADAPDAAPHGLRFEVVENGPASGWAMAVVNRGTETLRVDFDPGLLTLEVLPPGDPKAKRRVKPKPRICRLPGELGRGGDARRFSVVLDPGEGIVEAFEPLLYCLPEGGVSPFVAGAEVRARFGFAPKTRVVWRGGRHEVPLEEQPPPFVARVLKHHRHHHHDRDHGGDDAEAEAKKADAADSADAGQPQADASPPAPPESDADPDDDADDEAVDESAAAVPIKELRGTPFELGADYTTEKAEPAKGLELALTRGSDALDVMHATATATIKNHDSIARRIYVRRELLTFQVSGPDGRTLCAPEPDDRAPDRQAFTYLRAGGSISLTSRLVELCPMDTFARPGLYVLEAQLDAFAKGDEFGYDAFVGRLVSDRTVVVRIRSGSLPFPGPRVLERVRVGAP